MNIELPSIPRETMLRLLLLRALAMLAVIGIALWVYLPSANAMQRKGLFILCLLALLLSIAQAIVIRRQGSLGIQLLCQFGADALLVSLLVFLTGGIHSPFILLFGLVIVTNGLHAHVLSVVLVSIATCVGYLSAIHAYAWIQHEPLSDESTLKILLQVSILLLVGGIMAAIARRQAGLAEQSHQMVRQHQNLQRMHHQVMASMSEGMVVLDRQLRIQDYNEAAHHIFAGQASVGMDIRQLSILPSPVVHHLQQNSGAHFQCEWSFRQRTYLIQVNRLPDNGGLACWLLSFVDITMMKRLESQLIKKDRLAALGRLSAMLAHELRNPMHTMSQAIDLLARVPDEKRAAVRDIIHEELQRLDRLIGDMLNYTNPLHPTPEEVDIRALLSASLHQEDPEGKHQVQVLCPARQLYEDPCHLRMVIDNLLRNALQASPEPGSVSIVFTPFPHGWRLEIRDRGEGIDPHIEHKLFEPFVSRHDGGTGLGLATVWQVCQANAWQIQHHREDGQTIFRVEKTPDANEESNMFLSTCEIPKASHG